jgi:hypothetical protein
MNLGELWLWVELLRRENAIDVPAAIVAQLCCRTKLDGESAAHYE